MGAHAVLDYGNAVKLSNIMVKKEHGYYLVLMQGMTMLNLSGLNFSSL